MQNENSQQCSIPSDINAQPNDMIGKIMGIGLMIGGLLVAGVIGYVMSIYVDEGAFSTSVAWLGFIVACLILVFPQVGLGIYLWRQTGSTEPEE